MNCFYKNIVRSKIGKNYKSMKTKITYIIGLKIIMLMCVGDCCN